MILTGPRIHEEVENCNIVLEPFKQEQINPNSYNYRLSDKLLVPVGDQEAGNIKFQEVTIPEDGYILETDTLYLGATYEVIGSSKYAMSLIGRSSIGRLGLFVQVSANLGHTNSSHCWTLELKASKRIRVYPRMKIGQVSFWTNLGTVDPYKGFYSNQSLPTVSKYDQLPI